MWGIFPLYWPLLEPAGAVEILAHRIVWSALTMAVLVAAMRRTPQLMAVVRDRRAMTLLTLAAVVVSLNWGAYIWGVNNERVVETSLGYFINPLVTVMMGVFVLGDRCGASSGIALAIASVAVVVLTIDYGRPAVVGARAGLHLRHLRLAKKQAGVGAVEGLTVETLVMAPLAAAYVIWLMATGGADFGTNGTGHALLITTAGIVTAIPLICFGAAANRVPLVVLGLLQYLAPVIQFALGVLVFREDMTAGRWIGFGLVWVALVIFTAETINNQRVRSNGLPRRRRRPREQRAPSPARGR
jgi:chloramphenicol-sensitive protein RarD